MAAWLDEAAKDSPPSGQPLPEVLLFSRSEASRDKMEARAVPAMGEPIDVAEFAKLFGEHHAWVWRLLGRTGVPPALIDDAVQDVFIVVHRRLPDFDGRAPLRAWIAGIAQRVAVRYARTELRAHRRAEVYLPPGGRRPPDEELEAQRAVTLVDALLARLSADQREVFVLADVEGFSAPEIAATLGIKLGTVYSRLHTARERFASELERWRQEQPAPAREDGHG
jgi:RNA polymerase sigma-70 factor (ECF subfamily)